MAQTGLTVASATKAEVRLTWTAADPAPVAYSVERKPLGASDFAALPLTAPAANYIDRSIDAFGTYVYRVRVGQNVSNEVTVGPPPVGVSTAARSYGRRLRMTMDANGDPAFAYLVIHDDDVDASHLEFVSWNRAAYKWNDTVKVAVAGSIEGSGPQGRTIELARDAVSNLWAVVYGAPDGMSMRLVTSRDNGVTWSAPQTYGCGDSYCVAPAFALANGKAYLAMAVGSIGVRLVTGDPGAAPSSWAGQTMPLPPGGVEYRTALDMAIDPAGAPAVAFWAASDSYNVILGLWRPATGTVKVTDTAGYQSDTTDVDLEFVGAEPHLLIEARRTEEFFARYDQNLWYVRGMGGTFSNPVSLPSDGNQTLSYASLAQGPGGRVAVAAVEVGGNDTGVRCGQMKLLERTDSAGWSVCSPIGRDDQPFAEVAYPRLAMAGNEKAYLGFSSSRQDAPQSGVLLWRQP